MSIPRLFLPSFSFFLLTALAAAANGFNITVKILLTIVIGNLFTSPDVLDSTNDHPIAHGISLTIGTTGMIDVASSIPTRAAIEVPTGVDIENIAIAIFEVISILS